MMRNLHRSIRAVFATGLVFAIVAGFASPSRLAAAGAASGAHILASNNQIARVLDAGGSLVTSAQTVTGLGAGEQLAAIAMRPQNNRLYGLTITDAGTVRIYHIDSGSGAPIATPLSDAPVGLSDGVNPVPITGAAFDISFNPTVDRIRVISNTGFNFRMNPNNGTLVDSDGVAPGINPDGMLKGGATTADATAYTNSFVNATATTLYTIDSGTNKVFIQNPPNNGTLANGLDVKLGGAVLDFTNAALDIPASVAVASPAVPATGLAYAVLTVGNEDGLYSLDLASGAVAMLGSLGTLDVLDIALAPAVPVGIALSVDATQLQRFRLDQPGTVAAVTVSGIMAGETVVGIDGRPATGQLFGLAVLAAADTASLYQIDPQTGVATPIGPGGISFVNGSNATVDLPDANAGYGFDFNPVVDRIRVTTGTGLNFRINPNTGVAVDGDAGATGTNPDSAIGAANTVTATAYTNSFNGATATTLYTLDSTNNTLLIQNPPNNGTQTNALTVQLDGTPLDFTAVNGFDIPTAVVAPSPNAPVSSGIGYAALGVGGTTSLYRINLVSGTATVVGSIGNGTVGAGGLVVWTPINLPSVYERFAPIVKGVKSS